MKSKKQTKRTGMQATVHKIGRSVKHYYPKVLSVFLSLLLVYQCFMTDGVSYAVAEALSPSPTNELSLTQEDATTPESGSDQGDTVSTPPTRIFQALNKQVKLKKAPTQV